MKNVFVVACLLASLSSKSQINFTVKEYSVDLYRFPSYSQADLESAIQDVKKSRYFDYHYVNSGCNDKSHYISLWFRKKFNIQTFKIWNFAKNMIYYNGKGVQLKIKDPNLLTENDSLYWGFHVAVGVLRKNIKDKKLTIDTVVIDLPFNDLAPIKFSQWLSYQNQKNTYYTFTESKYRLFETIIPAYQEKADSALIKKTGIQYVRQLNDLSIFAGSFYDDTFALSDENMITANALARDIIVMKYYNEIIRPKILKDVELTALYKRLEQWQPYENRKVFELTGQGISEKEARNKLLSEKMSLQNEIRRLRFKYTSAIADIDKLDLPEEYENKIDMLTNEIHNHIKGDLL